MPFVLYMSAFTAGCVIGWNLGGMVERQRQRENSAFVRTE